MGEASVVVGCRAEGLGMERGRCFLAEHQRLMSQFAGLARWLGRSFSAQLSLFGWCASWKSR